MVTADVDDLGALGESPDLGLLQVLQVVVVRSAQRGAQRPVVASDDGSAETRGNLLVDAVLDAQAGGAHGVLEDGGVLVVTDTTDVDDAVRGQDVLGAAGRVLGRAAGDELGVVVGEKVLVEGDVRVLGQDGVVGLEVVLGEEGLVAGGLDVWGCPCQPFCFLTSGITKKPWDNGGVRCRTPASRTVRSKGPSGADAGSYVPRRGFSRQKRAYSVAILMFN